MTTIILNATIADGANEFISALEQLCAERSMTVDLKCPSSDVCIMIVNKEATGTEVAPEEHTPDVVPVCVTVPSPVAVELPPVEVTMEPANEVPPQTVPGPAPQEVASQQFSREVVVFSLSTMCAIPTRYDGAQATSKLFVSQVERLADMLIFEYCGSTFKFPVISALPANSSIAQDVINKFDEEAGPNDQMIRIVIQFTDSMTTHAIAVEVLEKLPDDPYHIVFGYDLEQLQ
jgi:hypothetical protein